MWILDRVGRKYNSLSKTAKASLWFTGCYVIQRGLQFIGMPIYTRIMLAKDYGVYSVFLSWFNLICVFSSLSIYNGTFNKAMMKYEPQRDKYISSVQSLTAIISLLFIAVILLFHNSIDEWTGYDIRFQLLIGIHLFFFPVLQYWSQKQRFLFEYKKLVFVTLVHSTASFSIGVLFVLCSEEKSIALIAATVGVQAVISIGFFASMARKGGCFYNKEFWNWSLATAVPLLPHYLSEILLGHADRLMIDRMCGAAQAGIYNIAYQISMVMTIIRTGINGAFTPWLYYSLKEKKYGAIRTTTKLITLLMWFLTLLFMLIGPEVLKIAAPPSYYEAMVDIPAIMIGCFFIFLYVLFLNVEIYYEQNQYAAFASVVAAIVNVILNYVCIPTFGYLAAGYTTMVSYMLMAVLHYLFLKRIIRQHEELKEVYDFGFIMWMSFALVLIGIVLLKLYEAVLLRWILIIGISAFSFIKRETIWKTLKMMKNGEKGEGNK